MSRNKRESHYLHKQQEWKELYHSGQSFTEIAKNEDIHYTTVQRVLNGVVAPRMKQKFAHYAKEWVRLYNEGWSSSSIAKTYETTTGTVTKYLKQEGVELARKGPTSKLKKYVPQWIELYENGHSLKEIGDWYGTYPQTVHKHIKDKTSMRTYTETSQRYELEQPDYFQEIDSPEKAYWLGVWFSTGFVSKAVGGYECTLHLSKKDLPLLERFQGVIGSYKPIEYRDYENGSVSAKLRVLNKKMYEDLLKQGLRSDKYDVEKVPPIPDEFYSSFALGYFEGKGSCFESSSVQKGTRYHKIVLVFFGNQVFLQHLKEIILNQTGETMYSATYNPGSWGKEQTYGIRRSSRESVKNIIHWLYRDAHGIPVHKDARLVMRSLESKIGRI
ncbi:hypothetical protein IMZ31_20110 (plasmid) [Pontibacillus sp. ALD_SL1]|uniref:hypothetical protein n=1 Tax=Pontibacillus sp. ALD_SL1 TaxID=2777185 RepID=UPI001A967005|nr:hypothetical protein [Pontibacillus sp. ALD_SL1]QST02856.1 hypothetical protein IMZ31_20110 [Pontibacillus sp. ALD_SL1]